MKRYLIVALFALGACNNSTTEEKKGTLPSDMVSNPHTASGIDTVSAALKPTMDFKDTLHVFGTIHQSEKITHEFAFTNNGKTPLLISSAAASCGCTVPEYPHDPVQPGQSGVLKVTFDSKGKSGHQEKSITVHTNTVKGIHMLYIKGEVDAPKSADGLPTQ